MAFVRNHGLSIYFEDSGAGPPVVLGHSFLCSGKMWNEQVPVLAKKYRVLNLDFRGHGNSSEVTQSFSLYDAISDVVAVLDELGIEKATWCGLSVGGMVALRAALTCPQRVERLILLDTDAGAESLLRKLKYNGMGFGARLLGIGPFLSPIARLMFGTTTRQENPTLVSEWKREFSAVHVPSVLRALKALTQRDSLLANLHRISVPTLVLVGEEDRSLPPSLSNRIHDRMPNSTLVQIPAAGHLSTLEQPEAVNEAMLDFLERELS
ncbi:MAG: alpha/beta fold hydrolase [Rubricoccaceae bacterium]|nr:alpha/beta fold hydrolase [Rubricoccaceae bacterium]